MFVGWLKLAARSQDHWLPPSVVLHFLEMYQAPHRTPPRTCVHPITAEETFYPYFPSILPATPRPSVGRLSAVAGSLVLANREIGHTLRLLRRPTDSPQP